MNYMPAVIFLACLPSSPEVYDGQVILNKNLHLWIDTNYFWGRAFIINNYILAYREARRRERNG
jgi:hypothetical protein